MRRRQALLSLVFLCLAGCAQQPPASVFDRTWAAHLEVLELSNRAYERTLIDSAFAHRRGEISAEKLNQIREAGLACEAAIRSARAELTAFLIGKSPEQTARMAEATAKLQTTLLKLIETARR